MASPRVKIQAFQATVYEEERIHKVIKFLDVKKSHYIRDLVMKDVKKQEHKIKGLEYDKAKEVY